MTRVLIVGCPGAGKSCFARALSEITHLPLTHLDNLYWNDDRTTVPKEGFLLRLQDALAQNEWIIDGNYLSTMDQRLSKCDTVFFFDLPTDVCLGGIRERSGKKRPDLPWVETEVDAEFEAFVLNFNEDSRPRVKSLLDSYSEVNVITFNSREESVRYLEQLKNEQR